MSYADFTISRLVKQFSLTIQEKTDLYHAIPSAVVRPDFAVYLDRITSLALPLSTEKARSEFLIAPVLAEFWFMTDQQVGLLSGVDFPVDPENGLVGICDYIITKAPEQLYVTPPVIVLVEAKNEDMRRGYPQCVAEMIAAQRFNENEGAPSEKVYGVVTIGNLWKFLELEGATVRIDRAEYGAKDLGKILAILLHMAGR